jgi:SAM-dependent methyltransferase
VTSGDRPPPIDWGAGEYERTAEELEPVARQVVELAGVFPGERVLDLACGTGNAALLCASAGGVVSGLDSSQRLIEVARARAASQELDANFVVGDLERLPFAEHEFDLVLSIFGVVFGSDPDRAASELLRVLAPAGRALITAWIPEGALSAMVGIGLRAVQEAIGAQGGPRFAWSNRDAVGELFGRHGARVTFEEAAVAFTADSPEAYFEYAQAEHPAQVSSRDVLERAGTYAAVRSKMIAALRDGNEDPAAFRVTSRYLIVRISPGLRAPS